MKLNKVSLQQSEKGYKAFIEDGNPTRKFISASKLKSATSTFDMQAKAEELAIKRKVSVESILSQWNEKKLIGLERGRFVDEVCESLINGVPIDYDAIIERNSTKHNFTKSDIVSISQSWNKDVVDRLRHLGGKSGEVYAQYIAACSVLGENRGIATMGDLMLLDTRNKNCFFFDIKADEKIDKYSMYGSKMAMELSDYDDCKYNQYRFQVILSQICVNRQKGVWDANGNFIDLSTYQFRGGAIIHYDMKEKRFKFYSIESNSGEAKAFLESSMFFVKGYIERTRL